MKMEKTFACLLAVLLIFGIMPTGVFADETSDGESTDEPHYKVAVQLTDSETDFTNGNPYYSLEGLCVRHLQGCRRSGQLSVLGTRAIRNNASYRCKRLLRGSGRIAERKLCCDYAHKSNGGIATIGIITFLESRIRMFS